MIGALQKRRQMVEQENLSILQCFSTRIIILLQPVHIPERINYSIGHLFNQSLSQSAVILIGVTEPHPGDKAGEAAGRRTFCGRQEDL